MRGFLVGLFGFLVAAASLAAPLKIVDVSAPAINCKFDPSCKIVVTDSVANFTLPGSSGNAFLLVSDLAGGETRHGGGRTIRV